MCFTFRFFALILLVTLSLVACGGGGGGSSGSSQQALSPNPAPEPVQPAVPAPDPDPDPSTPDRDPDPVPVPDPDLGPDPEPIPDPELDPEPEPDPDPETEPRTILSTVSVTVTGMDSLVLPDLEKTMVLRLTHEYTEAIPVNYDFLIIDFDGEYTFMNKVWNGVEFTVDVMGSSLAVYCGIVEGTHTGIMPDNNIEDIKVECTNRHHDIAGMVSAETNVVIDDDTNDRNDYYLGNNSFSEAQPLVSPVSILGFLTWQATGNTETPLGRFSLISDPEDYFKVGLKAGQLVSLHVSGTEEGADLDLYLLDMSEQVKTASLLGGSLEQVLVPEDGDYYLKVESVQGTSSYILDIEPPELSMPLITTQSMNFVPGEVLLYGSRNGLDNARAALSGNSLQIRSLGRSSFQPQSEYELIRFDLPASPTGATSGL